MVKIYAIIDKNGAVYVGSTKQNLKKRFCQHRCHTQKWYQTIDFKNSEIKELEVCDDSKRYEREQYWIDVFSAVNKSKAGAGPVGFYPDQKEINRRREQMIEWRKNNPEKIKKAKQSSLTSEKQRQRSMIGHQKRWEKMPKWKAICKKTGKEFGPYSGYFVAQKELGLHECTLIRGLLHGTQTRNFVFKYLEQ